MRQYPGFEGKEKRKAIQPVPDRDRVIPTRMRLMQLLRESKMAHLSPRTVGMIQRLATMSGVIRLVVNLKTVFGLMAQSEVTSILVEGLTDDERRVLLEIGVSGLSSGSKETAHALFSLDARMAVVIALRTVFRKARMARGQELSEEDVKEIMEE